VWSHRTVALSLVALSLACTSRRCAGIQPLRAAVATRTGAGYEATLVCAVDTRVVIDRSTQPLLRGCSALTTFEVRAYDTTRRAPIDEASQRFGDCRDAEGYCRSVRGEIVERQTSSGTIVGARSLGAQKSRYFFVTTTGPIAYEREHESVAIDRLPEPGELAMQRAREGALSDREGDRYPGFVALFTAPFVAAHGDELEALAARCALRAPIVAAIARHRPTVFEPLFRAEFVDALAPSCAGRVGGLASADEARYRRMLIETFASATLTQRPDVRTSILLSVATSRMHEALPSVLREARNVASSVEVDVEDRRRWATALCALVALEPAHAHESLLPVFEQQPASDTRQRPVSQCVVGRPSMTWNTPAEALADALNSLRTPPVLSALTRIASDRSKPESTRSLARAVLAQAAPRDR
jgi:hypothetical protein